MLLPILTVGGKSKVKGILAQLLELLLKRQQLTLLEKYPETKE